MRMTFSVPKSATIDPCDEIGRARAELVGRSSRELSPCVGQVDVEELPDPGIDALLERAQLLGELLAGQAELVDQVGDRQDENRDARRR